MKNQANLKGLTTLFLDLLMNSRASCPLPLRWLAHYIRLSTTNKFRGEEFKKALTSVFFLQFLCPALTSPVSNKLVANTPVNQTLKMRRTLILVSKILQTLANKQASTTPLGTMLKEYEDLLQLFLQMISDTPSQYTMSHYSVSFSHYQISLQYIKALVEKDSDNLLQTLKTNIAFCNGTRKVEHIIAFLEGPKGENHTTEVKEPKESTRHPKEHKEHISFKNDLTKNRRKSMGAQSRNVKRYSLSASEQTELEKKKRKKTQNRQ